MRLKVWSSVLAVILFFAAVPSFSQARPSAKTGGLPLVVGAGYSNYDVDFGGGGRISGGTLWADWTIRQMPRRFYGLGVEFTARDLSLDGSSRLSSMRSAGGNIIYHYLRPRNFRPYVKAGGQYTSFTLPPLGNFYRDSRSLYAVGGGADFRAWSQVWVRADYEYQIWPSALGIPRPNVNGFTIGPQWDFGRRREN